MGYNPDDHRITFRQVLAGWIVCLALVGLAVAATRHHHGIPRANAGDSPYAASAAYSPGVVRLPYFAACAAERRDAARTARGPMSMPSNSCS